MKSLLVVTAVLGFQNAYAAAALVQIDVGACFMEDGNGNEIVACAPGVTGCDSTYKIKQKVTTQSANGTLKFTCVVDNVPNDTGEAVIYNLANTGSVCTIRDPLTGDIRPADVWQQTVSPDGTSILFCQAHSL